ncbi:hypothetical protein BU16DRAFT_117724 [Lophium mytilinum]|uniref:FAD-binding FR-type domain-containing protein n=1 Tax=Lophium mytilinum TaxID=390894 RepID=A0A6A6QGL7_9PEZI|nr:hypothetical protein BU16DRAFT_117724 [Lophium mytilinum]
MGSAPSIIVRPQSGMLVVLGTSALGGAAYRYGTTSDSDDTSLNPHSFTPYTLVSKQPISSTSTIFTLRNRSGSPDPESLKDVWKRSVWSVQVKQPQLQIARAYTPLPPHAGRSEGEHDETQELRLLIRKEEGGEVSTYVHKLPEQSTVELRGPNVEHELPHDTKEVLFLAGGTGIAPAMQVAHALRSKPGARLHILWANRNREDCVGGQSDGLQAAPPGRVSGWRSMFGLEEPVLTQESATPPAKQGVIVKELEAMKDSSKSHGSGLGVEYFVDDERNFIKPVNVARHLKLSDQNDGAPSKEGKVILVSGPDGFIEHWAGKKLWIGGREVQGPLGGVLSQMDLRGWQVYKL